MSEDTSSDSKDKSSNIDLGLSTLLRGGGEQLKAASAEVGALSEILKNSVELSKEQKVETEEKTQDNGKYQELAAKENWPELSKYCEDKLSASRDLDKSAKLWWIKSQFQTGAIPVSILAPSLNLISREFLTDSNISSGEKKLCSELLSQFTKNLIANSDYELGLSFLGYLFESGDKSGPAALLSDLEKKVKADSAFLSNDNVISEISALKAKYSLSAPLFTAAKTEIKPPNVPAAKKSYFAYVLVAVVLFFLLAAAYYIYPLTASSKEFKPSFDIALTVPDHVLIEPQPERIAGLNHLDALLYEVSEDEKPALESRPAIVTGNVSRTTSPVAMIPNRSSEELARVGNGGNQTAKQGVNTTYPLEKSNGSDAVRDADPEEEIPEIDFPPFRSNKKTETQKNGPNYVVIARTRVMSEPSYWSYAGSDLKEGDKVLVQEVQGKWLKIKAKNGNIGYILAQDAVKIY